MGNRGVRKGLSLLMTMLLCVTSFNFSLIAQAGDAGAARIIGFNPLDESIATQSLPVGASIDDVVFPDSIKATVETIEEVADTSIEAITDRFSFYTVDKAERDALEAAGYNCQEAEFNAY